MAQKIGLALIAFFGLANCEIYAQSNHYILGSAPVVSFKAKQRHQDDSNNHGLGDSHVKLGIINFANQSGHHFENDGDDHHGGRLRRNGSSQKSERRSGASDGVKRKASADIKKRPSSPDQKKRQDSNDRREKSSNGKKRQASAGNKKEPSPQKKKEPSTQKKKEPSVQKRKEPSVQKRKEPSAQKRRESSGDKRRDSSGDKRRGSGSQDKVKIPVFQNLRYVDNDKSGEFEKAPITIVTAPLISTAEIEDHKPGVNNVRGKSNCPQCREQNHQAKETKISASKSIQRFDDLLKTKIEAPIKNVEVHEEEETSQEKNDHRQFDSYKGAKINKQKLKYQLAQGEKNEHRPFVVGSVVIARGEEDSGHKTHGHERHDHEHKHNHK